MPNLSTQIDRKADNKTLAPHLPNYPRASAPLGFFSVDNFWNITEWNKDASDILGISTISLQGKNFVAEFQETLPVEFYVYCQKPFENIGVVHFTEYWVEKNVWLDIILFSVQDGLQVSFKNSILQKSGKMPAPEPAKREYMNEVVPCDYEWNLAKQTLQWKGRGHSLLLGYDTTDTTVPQQFWEHLVHPDDLDGILECLSELRLQTKSAPWLREYRLKHADGIYRHVRDHGNIILKNSIPTKIVGQLTDISEIKHAETNARERAHELDTILNETANCILIAGADQKIKWMNRAFSVLTGFVKEDVQDHAFEHYLFGPGSSAKEIAAIRKKVTANQSFTSELITYSKSGESMWTSLVGFPMRTIQGDFKEYYIIQNDISRKKELQNQLLHEHSIRKANLTKAVLIALQAERAEIGMELHDNINQILGATKLYIEMAGKDAPNKDEHLAKAVDLLSTAIEEIRKISKDMIPTGNATLGLKTRIERVVHDLNIVARTRFSLLIEGVGLEKLNQKLKQNLFRIIQEQLNNIVKHAHAEHASVKLLKSTNSVMLNIRDNGLGADNAVPARGVGLQHMLSRIKAHNGTMQIVTTPGHGFEMKIKIPLLPGGEKK